MVFDQKVQSQTLIEINYNKTKNLVIFVLRMKLSVKYCRFFSAALITSKWRIILLCLFFISCQRIRYRITGDNPDCAGCPVKLIFLANIDEGMRVLDSGMIDKSGKFILSGTVAKKAFYDVLIDNSAQKYFLPTTIYLEGSSINIIYPRYKVGNRWVKYPKVISTSLIQNQFSEFRHSLDSSTKVYFERKESFSQRIDRAMNNDELLRKLADSSNLFQDSLRFFLSRPAESFAQRHLNSIASPYILVHYAISNKSDLLICQRLYNELDPGIQQSECGKILKARLDGETNESLGFIGDTISVLHGRDTLGRHLNFPGILENNKVVLIDFWASWCGSCRMEMPELKKIYEKYHSRGFDIVAVSLDNDSLRWTKAIKQDNLPAHHISELKGGYGIDPQRFKITSIPQNLIINKQGIVIASDIYPDSVATLLEGTLK